MPSSNPCNVFCMAVIHTVLHFQMHGPGPDPEIILAGGGGGGGMYNNKKVYRGRPGYESTKSAQKGEVWTPCPPPSAPVDKSREPASIELIKFTRASLNLVLWLNC